MNYPPIDKATLAKLSGGRMALPLPNSPSQTYNLTLNLAPKREPPRSLTSEECISLFGTRDAVLMNFIPQMLTALALEQADEFNQYCAKYRLSDYKRHNREIRKCIEEYNAQLRKSYGVSWQIYLRYLGRLRNAVAGDLFKCWLTFTNEASRQYVGEPHRDIPARVALIRMLIAYVEDFDKVTDKIIAERLNAPCSRKQNPYCLLISLLCMDIADTFGKAINVTETMTRCVKVLHNRCYEVVDEIMAEENAPQEPPS